MPTINVNPITENTNLVNQTAERQISFVGENSPNLNNLLRVFARELQEVHSEAIIPMLYDRTLARAAGTNLDNLGELAGIQRQGLSDNQYRVLIRVINSAKRSRGTVNDILDIVYDAFGDRFAIYQKGVEYNFDLGISTCPNVSLAVTFGDPPFGFEGDSESSGYNSPTIQDQGELSARSGTDLNVNDIIINELIRHFPTISVYKLLNKSTTPFGFQGNPHARGYSAGTTQGGHMSSILRTNRP